VYRFVPGYSSKSWDKSEAGYRRPDGYSLLKADRVEMPALPVKESLKSFVEMIRGYSAEQAVKEADRCVECGICVAECPAHMDIPGYIRAVREGDIDQGMRLLYETNPFPASCGRICTHRCEEVCAVGHSGDPIAIRWLKRYIADQVELADYSKALPVPAAKTGKKVAVIGAGPGGLTAAYYLRMLGHEVTVMEARDHAGGMLRYGIPEYRLPYEQLDKDIEYIRSLGVRIQYGKTVDSAAFKKAGKEYNAVFFSTGLNEPYRLGVDGEDHPRVLSGLDVLDEVTRGADPKLGKTVAVIGGGNVAMDAARTARRYGAEVTILYRRRIEDMPADNEEIVEAAEEGVTIITQAIPLRVQDAGKGKVALVWNKARMVDDPGGGRPTPEAIDGEIYTFVCNSIVSAVGQGSSLSFLPEESESRVAVRRYKPVVDERGKTGNPAVFAGGDIVNDRKDAVSAIGDGHAAALSIDRYLRKGRGI
jgi:glutamate synthase (NADPH/NADH) small chain